MHLIGSVTTTRGGSALRKLLLAAFSEPICLFFLAGGLLVLIDRGFDTHLGGDKAIIVDDGSFGEYLSRRLNLYDRQALAAIERSLGVPERDALVRDLLREEVLYREAIARGFDRDDIVIRRRLIERMSFLAPPEPSVSEEEARAFYDAHRPRYVTPPRVSFQHVFFDAAKRGRGEAMADAKAMLGEMKSQPSSLLARPPAGDVFPLGSEIGPVSQDHARQLLGEAMATAIFGVEDDAWHGPFASPAGAHLVRITNRVPPAEQSYKDVKQQIAADAQHAKGFARLEAMADELLADYRIQVNLESR
jgi:peptidyl-prolyl cis-trans isomerase C